MTLGRIAGNLGWLAFRNQLLTQEQPITAYPLYQVIDASSARLSEAWLQRAAALGGDDPILQWKLGRAALAQGDAETAAKWLAPLAAEAQSNLLLQLDRLTALSLTHRTDQVLKAIKTQSVPKELWPEPVRAVVEDQVAAYLQTETRESLEAALQLRPFDLYANYRMWQEAQRSGDAAKTESHRQALIRFAREAIDPASERVLDYAASIAPDIRAHGLWDRAQLRRAVAFWVWRHSDSAGVEQLLKDLISQYPNEAEWGTYLAELQARQAGQPVDQVDVSELNSEQADRQFAAGQLGMAIDRIELGPNLVENGDFAQWSKAGPVGWRFNQYLGNSKADGLYVPGQDSLDANKLAARIDAIWGGNLGDGTLTFGEYIGQAFRVDSGRYLVTIVYRYEQNDAGSVLVFVGEYSQVGGFVMVNQSLPSTHDELRVLRLMVNVSRLSTSIMPVVRNWGLGQLSVQAVSVRPVIATTISDHP